MYYSEEEVSLICRKVKPRKGRSGFMVMGGKGEIADILIDKLPSADVFIDVFGGGGSVTLAALRSGKYKRVVYNDVNPTLFNAMSLCKSGLVDDYKLEFYTKERYLTTSDCVAKLCFSFNGKIENYGYNLNDQNLIGAMHDVAANSYYNSADVVFPELIEDIQFAEGLCKSREHFRCAVQTIVSNYFGERGKFGANWKKGQCYLRLLHLERFNRFKNTSFELRSSKSVVSLMCEHYTQTTTGLDDCNCVIYCDPPYKDKEGYIGFSKFDYDDFQDWMSEQKHSVFLSESFKFPQYKVLWEGYNNGRIDYNSTKRVERLYQVR